MEGGQGHEHKWKKIVETKETIKRSVVNSKSSPNETDKIFSNPWNGGKKVRNDGSQIPEGDLLLTFQPRRLLITTPVS
jgi:hypothetical protein